MPPTRKKITDKKNTKTVNRKTRVETCRIGYCNDEEKLNKCRISRVVGTNVNTLKYGTIKTETRSFIREPVRKRFHYNRLFQETNDTFTNIELHDISIYLKISTYHEKRRANTVNIPTENPQNTVITTLLSPITIKFFIVEICDVDLAKKKVITLDEIIKNKDLQNLNFQDAFKVRHKKEVTITCSTCNFTEDEIFLCMDLNKLKVCLNFNQENEAKVFDKGNYAFVYFVDYMEWMYQFKRKRTNDEEEEILSLGETFNTTEGNSGIPSFFNDGYVEVAWRPDMRHGPTYNRFLQLLTDCCKKEPEGETEGDAE
jgi:hypothetical protein